MPRPISKALLEKATACLVELRKAGRLEKDENYFVEFSFDQPNTEKGLVTIYKVAMKSMI